MEKKGIAKRLIEGLKIGWGIWRHQLRVAVFVLGIVSTGYLLSTVLPDKLGYLYQLLTWLVLVCVVSDFLHGIVGEIIRENIYEKGLWNILRDAWEKRKTE